MNVERSILKANDYPRMIREFAEANFNLKILTAVSLGLVLLALMVIIFLVRQGPEVIALGPGGEVALVETKVTDLQISAAIREYVAFRYSWDEKSIGARLKLAQFFVHPSLVKAFDKATSEIAKYVKEKKVRQRVYPKGDPVVDLEKKTVRLTLDRFTEFDGLKAATEMQLELAFVVDSRTLPNPWGVYVTKETETGAQ